MRLLHRPACLAACALAFAPAFAGEGEIHPADATIREIQAAFAAGTMTSERLAQLYLDRIQEFDRAGPQLNSIVVLNPHALAQARESDAERELRGARSLIHGIPVLLKDNFSTRDLPTSVGSQLLAEWIPARDAELVIRLRDAGAIILGKTNLSEFAAGGSIGLPAGIGPIPIGYSSAGGQTRNPNDPTRHPGASSGGSGAAIAAAFAQVALGSDSGGSIRGPCAANGIAGLKPTHGLLDLHGIVPLAPSFDTAGPMARYVEDVAVTLEILVRPEHGRHPIEPDFTSRLQVGALRGARIGVARGFTNRDAGVDEVFASAIARLESAGAIVVDPVAFPDYVLQSRYEMFLTIVYAEFKAGLESFLNGLPERFPRTCDEFLRRADDPSFHYRSPEKAAGLRHTFAAALTLQDPLYRAARDQGVGLVRAGVQALFEQHRLDAVIFPTEPRPAGPIVRQPGQPTAIGIESPSRIANLAGTPELVVPAGMTDAGMPVAISFLGPRWSEARLLSFGYDFEQASKARTLPRFTPASERRDLGRQKSGE